MNRCFVLLAVCIVAESLPCITSPPFLIPSPEVVVNKVTPVPGPYKTTWAKIANIPELHLGKPHTGSIWYPDVPEAPAGGFPFVSFAHGAAEGSALPSPEKEYPELLELVASYGFIIVAPDSCVNMCYDYYKDQLQTIVECSANRTLHPALEMANFDKIGVFGHSMGAMASIISAGSLKGIDPAKYNITAAVSMHPCGNPVVKQTPETVSVPILFTAGSADVVCEDGCAKSVYEKVKKNAIFFDINGIGHMDPTTSGGWHELQVVAYFLACHVRGEHCDMIYGSNGKEICTQKFEVSECYVK